MRLALVALPLLASCDILFELRDVKNEPDDAASEASIDAPARCMFSDNFDDNQLSAQWRVHDPAHVGALVTEKAGRLDMQLRTDKLGYNGITSVERHSIVGRTLRATAFPMSEAGYVETYMQISIDELNNIYFHTGVGNMTFGVRINGNNDRPYVTYDPQKHRYWQFRHDAVAGVVHFEVSGDGLTFDPARTVVAPFSLDAMLISFSAGTFLIGNPDPGVAHYDDVMLCDPAD